MKRVILSLMACALFVGTSTASFAQEEKEGKIQQRKENQQKRIGKGVSNGSMTAGETAKVEHQEKNVNKEVRADRKANGGNLTNNEKKQVNRQQNRMSKEIYNDKHDANNQPQ